MPGRADDQCRFGAAHTDYAERMNRHDRVNAADGAIDTGMHILGHPARVRGPTLLVVVQHPITDVRGLIDDGHRIGAPSWPKPLRVFPRGSADDCRTDFIRGIGPVRERMRGNPSPWLNEKYYVDARRNIVLSRLSGEGIRLRPVFRRFYSDGKVARFEIGFSCRGPVLRQPPEAMVATAAGAALMVSTRFRGRLPQTGQPLAHFGRTLADHLLHGTTRSAPATAAHGWWVTAGAPAVFVETQQRTGSDAHLAIAHSWLRTQGQRVSCWSTHDTPQTNRELLRVLRIQLSHMHAELSALETVLGFCEAGRLEPEDQRVADFLATVCDGLLRTERNGLTQHAYLAEVVDAAQGFQAEQIWMLRSLGERVTSKGIARKIRDASSVLETALHSSSTPIVLAFHEGAIMTKNEVNMHGGTVGAVTAGEATIGKLEQHVGTSGPDLAALVAELVKVVGDLRGDVPDDVVDQAEDTAEGISKEIVKDEPNTGAIQRRLNSLLTLVKGVGSAGEAVATAIDAIRTALGG
jgi:hypothetical protein